MPLPPAASRPAGDVPATVFPAAKGGLEPSTASSVVLGKSGGEQPHSPADAGLRAIPTPTPARRVLDCANPLALCPGQPHAPQFSPPDGLKALGKGFEGSLSTFWTLWAVSGLVGTAKRFLLAVKSIVAAAKTILWKPERILWESKRILWNTERILWKVQRVLWDPERIDWKLQQVRWKAQRILWTAQEVVAAFQRVAGMT